MAMAELRKLGRSWLIGVTLIAVGAVVGYALPQNTVSPKSEVGLVTSASPAPAGDGTATIVSFTPRGGTRQTLLINDFTPWQGKQSGPWSHVSEAPCLSSSATPDRVTLGMVTIHAVGSAPGGTVV